MKHDLMCRDATIQGELLMWSARLGGALVMDGYASQRGGHLEVTVGVTL
ncbi:hypothetical protein ACH4FA_35390 [Streptomyces sp. NPDC017966]|nr:hypothetical protein [Streptomyces sp. AC558_RSS880]